MPGRFPLPGPFNCEGVLCNNLGSGGSTGISNTPQCGMPTEGGQYARLEANGPFSVPPGGPPGYPLPPSVTELRVPIPPIAVQVSFCWDFFNAEGFQSPRNDGMAVAVVNPLGGLVQLLLYADMGTQLASCADFTSFFGVDVAPTGPQSFSGFLPLLTGGEYLSISCWNGSDNFTPSHLKIDDIQFFLPSGCPMPPATPPNDECVNALPVGLGLNGPFNNNNATTSVVSPGCGFQGDYADVWFAFTPACAANYQVDTCGAGFNTILSVFDGCPAVNEVACNDDDFNGICGNFTDSHLSFFGNIGTTYYIRVAGNAFFGGVTGTFNLTIAPEMTFNFTSPAVGQVGFDILNGPPGGLYFAAITANAGNFPFGVFFGIDISLQEILNEFFTGFPFVGPLSACGDFSFGPVGGLPSGLQLYGTALGFPGPTLGVPSANAVMPSSVVVQ
jgi:hypothetical protein